MTHQATDVLVNAVNHRRKDFHPSFFPHSFIFREFFPGGNVIRPRAQLVLRVDDAQLYLLRIAACSEFVPAQSVPPLVLQNVFLLCLKRIVRCVEGNVLKERFFGFECLVDESDRVVDVGISCIKIVAEVRPFFAIQAERVVACEEVGGS